MKISARLELNLDELDGGHVVVQILKREHSRIVSDCLALLEKTKLPRPQAEDFKNNIATAKAMEGVLEYYMEHWEYNSWEHEHSVASSIKKADIGD